ncbi:MAG TPA: hypothetical protein PK951_03725, partial [Chitinophagaceae bacterium]|nr:hypothetical protein [Chitinophagaceae bacterium]
MKSFGFKLIGVIFSVSILFSACRKKDALLPDNYVSFETDSQGLSAGENSITVKLKLSRNTDKDIPLVVKMVTSGLELGTDFTTAPAVNATGEIQLVIPSGNNEASITISKVPGALYDGDESVSFEIYSSGSPVLISNSKKFNLTFAELIAGTGSATINGGGVL